MAHDVYVTHSPKDEAMAYIACAALEAAGIKCWIASRDIGKRQDQKKVTIKAIRAAKVMVMVFSGSSNMADNLAGEMNTAINADLSIVPLRIENAEPEGVMQYYLADTHWFDVSSTPTDEQLQSLVNTIKPLLIKKRVRVKTKPYPEQKTREKPRSRTEKTLIITGTTAAIVIFLFGIISISLSLFRVVEVVEAIIRTL